MDVMDESLYHPLYILSNYLSYLTTFFPGFFTAADAEAGLKGSSSLVGYAAMVLDRWKTTMESHMNKERKAGRWTLTAAARAADQFAEMVCECI